MASRPEWLVETEIDHGQYGAIENDSMYQENNPSWLTPQPKQQKKKSSKNRLLSSESTPLRSTTQTERKRKKSQSSKKYKGGSTNDRMRLLEYKAGRPCCLSCFGILHATTIIAAVLAVVSQFLDLAAVYQNSMENSHQMSISDIFDLVQVIALHSYGMVFAMVIVLVESSEFEITNRWLKMCHENVLTEKWVIRGFIYNFIGLFALQSGREYVSIAIDPSSNEFFMFDSPGALALVRYSGVILMTVGFVYMFLGIACCKSLKDYQMREMKKAKDELIEYIEEMAEERNGSKYKNSMLATQEELEDGNNNLGGGGGGGELFLNRNDANDEEIPITSHLHWSQGGNGVMNSDDSPPPYSRTRNDMFLDTHQEDKVVDPFQYEERQGKQHSVGSGSHSYQNNASSHVFVRSANQYEHDEGLQNSFAIAHDEDDEPVVSVRSRNNPPHAYEHRYGDEDDDDDDDYQHVYDAEQELHHHYEGGEGVHDADDGAYGGEADFHGEEEGSGYNGDEPPHGDTHRHDAHRLWMSEEPNPPYENNSHYRQSWAN